MSYNNIVIEDSDGKKYHPQTNISNILGIKEVLSKNNISIEAEVSFIGSLKKSGNYYGYFHDGPVEPGFYLVEVYENGEEEKKIITQRITKINEGVHGSSENNGRTFIRNSYFDKGWDDWKELTNTGTEKEIDNLKQFGIEVNKILVDALNSKNIQASTNNSIKTNVEKVKNIKAPKGNAQAEDVLSGKTFSNDTESEIKGTMRSITDRTIFLNNEGEIKNLDKVYCDKIKIKADITNLRAENIPLGTTIGGVHGTKKISVENDHYIIPTLRPNETIKGPQPPYGKRWTGYLIFSNVSSLEIFDLSNENLIYSDGEKYVRKVSNDGRNVSVTFSSKALPPDSKVIFALSYY